MQLSMPAGMPCLSLHQLIGRGTQENGIGFAARSTAARVVVAPMAV